MNRQTILISILLICINIPAFASEKLRLATTTSTENSGLLEELLPPFEQQCNCQVDVIAVGTGKAIKLGEHGDVDVILVHARNREDRFVANGYGISRRDIMYNDFVLLGPANDPARVANKTDIAEAMKRLAAAGETFVSRGDDSGTHTREKELWKAAGVSPAGSWYLEAGRGMGEVIVMAGERQGYTLSDRGTYLAFKEKTDLMVVAEGDQRLFNPYGAIMVNPQRHPHVKSELAKKLLDYLVSTQAQTLISAFRRGGEQLFYIAE